MHNITKLSQNWQTSFFCYNEKLCLGNQVQEDCLGSGCHCPSARESSAVVIHVVHVPRSQLNWMKNCEEIQYILILVATVMRCLLFVPEMALCTVQQHHTQCQLKHCGGIVHARTQQPKCQSHILVRIWSQCTSLQTSLCHWVPNKDCHKTLAFICFVSWLSYSLVTWPFMPSTVVFSTLIFHRAILCMSHTKDQ